MTCIVLNFSTDVADIRRSASKEQQLAYQNLTNPLCAAVDALVAHAIQSVSDHSVKYYNRRNVQLLSFKFSLLKSPRLLVHD
jgi:hypothetical protein